MSGSLVCGDCKDGYYKQDDYCCAHDEFHRDNTCIKKSLALQNCANFDLAQKKCKFCEVGFVLSHG